MKTLTQTFIVLTALVTAPIYAQSSADDAAATDGEIFDSQAVGRELIMEMAGFLAGLDKMTVTARGGYEVLQSNGQMVQFLEVRDVSLARPNQMRVEEVTSDGSDNNVLFDGKHLTIWHGDGHIYAQAPQPGSIDDTAVYMIRDLGMRLPLAPFFTTRFPLELDRNVTFADYVDTTNVFGDPAHHVIGQTDSVDFQVWIADGERPFPLRIVLTYRNEPGQPSYWADFIDWNSRPRIPKSTFEFKPAPDAQQIVFAVQIPVIVEAPAAAPATSQGEAP